MSHAATSAPHGAAVIPGYEVRSSSLLAPSVTRRLIADFAKQRPAPRQSLRLTA
ncbi:hypothetical protein SALBM135S_03095 [Streptomyces alboniger]